MQLTTLMNELAEERRDEPRRRPHLRARAQRPRRGHARAPRDRAVLHPARGRRQRHHPHRHQPSACTCWRRTPTSAAIWQDDLDGVTPTAVEEIVRVASPVTFMRRTATQRPSRLGDHDFAEGDKVVLLLRRRQPRSARVRRSRALRRAAATRTRTSASAAPARTSASARTWPAASWRSMFRQLLTRLPDIEVDRRPGAARGDGHPARRRHQAPAGAVHARSARRERVSVERGRLSRARAGRAPRRRSEWPPSPWR